MGAECNARLLKLEFRARVPREGRVEQEADGSWVSGGYAGAGLDSILMRPAATGPFFQSQSLGRAYSAAWIKLRPFPETNFFQAAGSKPGAPVP